MLQQKIGGTICPTKVVILLDIGKFWLAIVRWPTVLFAALLRGSKNRDSTVNVCWNLCFLGKTVEFKHKWQV